MPGKVKRSARYLGPHILFDNGLSVERERRAAATRQAYFRFGKFWARCRNPRWTFVLFKSLVYGTAHSALVCFVLNQTDRQVLDSTVASLARKALHGACAITEHEGGAKSYRAKSNHDVLRKVRLLPA